MVCLTLRAISGKDVAVDVSRDASSASVQKKICGLFHQRFPAIKASFVIGDRCFDEFMHKPFFDCDDNIVAGVVFEETDDTFFYDLIQRKPDHPFLR